MANHVPIWEALKAVTFFNEHTAEPDVRYEKLCQSYVPFTPEQKQEIEAQHAGHHIEYVESSEIDW